MKLLLLAALLISACGAPSEPLARKDHQDEATRIVWNEIFHEEGPPPDIEWLEGDILNCGNGRGWMADHECYGGMFWFNRWFAQVAWFEGARFSTTAFAHELCHAHNNTLSGDDDGDHNGPCYVPGGLVDIASDRLFDEGL